MSRARATSAAWGWRVLPYLLVGVAALLPRVLDLGTFVTHDEAEFWIDRSEQFLLALQSGNPAATAISTHPGVTTMWLGMVGIFLRRGARAWGLVQEVPFPLLLALMQAPVALVHTAGVVAGYALLRRLVAPLVALLAALLWAADPFVIGYSRLLHVDALAGTFATLSLLAACVAWKQDPSHSPHSPRRHWLTASLSGVCAGLAILSKSPALAVVPVVGVLALVAGFSFFSSRSSRPERLSLAYLLRVLLPLLVWGVACGLTIVVVWPAVWAAPAHVVQVLRAGVEAEGAQPHMTGNFFLGREDPAPGLLFYPVVLALRTTPWTLAGLLLLPFAVRQPAPPTTPPDTRTIRTPYVLLVLAGFVLLFVVGLSIFPKKFNRYLVPAFPAIDVLAAVGLVWGAERLSRLLVYVYGADLRLALFKLLLRHADFYYLAKPADDTTTGVLQHRSTRLLVSALVVGALVNAAWYHPYSIAYFNQALGGAPAGARTFSVGWGEGLEQVAAWLNQQPDITGVVTAAIMVKSLNPYLRHGAQATTPDMGARLPDKTGYVVVSVYQAQGTVFPPFDQFYGRATPVQTVTIHGVDYAWVYQVAPAVAQAWPATFAAGSGPGETLHLRGYDRSGPPERGTTLVYHLFWRTTAQAPNRDYWLFAHLMGADGERVVQLDIPYPTATWGAHRFVTTELPLPLPADLPAGTYQLVVGLYDPASGVRVPLSAVESPAVVAPPALDGPDALLLDEVVVP